MVRNEQASSAEREAFKSMLETPGLAPEFLERLAVWQESIKAADEELNRTFAELRGRLL